MPLDNILEQILDMARWAPSGDNTQPWRFEVLDASRIVVHGFDTRTHCVYDLTGRPSQMSIGALLETMSIAASRHAKRMIARRRIEMPDDKPTFDIEFLHDSSLQPDPLADHVVQRSVQRRAMKIRRLSATEKQALEVSVADTCSVVWMESGAERLQMARLMFANAKLRLTTPECYRVHKDIIEWNARYSEDRVPDQALGVDPLTTRLMKFVMHDWDRVQFFNKFLAGTVMPRIAMDFVPGIACGAHFVLKLPAVPETIDDFILAGRAMQRFWLTSTRLGLFMQPEMTPLIFGGYVKSGIRFTKIDSLQSEAGSLQRRLDEILGTDWQRAFWMGRIGAGSAASARSTRLPLSRLIVSKQP